MLCRRIRTSWLPCLLVTCLFYTAGATAFAQAEAEEAALVPLRRVATNVQFHRDGSVRLVRLSKPGLNDEILSWLPNFPAMEYLAIVTPGATVDGFAHLASLKSIDTLLLSGSGITDESLSFLVGLPKLERLYLDDTEISDAGLEAIGRISSLRVLSLRRTKIGSNGFAWLRGLTALEECFLDGTQVDDASLACARHLKNLRTLHLNQTQITGSDLSSLAELKTLESLNLTGCPLASLDTDSLAAMPRLKTLNLYHTSVGPEAVQTVASLLGNRKGGVFGVSSSDAPTVASVAARKVAAPPRSAVVEQDILAPASVRFAAMNGAGNPQELETPDFQRHVLPLFGRLGCNGRACHGSFQGQGGFRLSMFGYDFAADHQALTAGDEPRVNRAQPETSLVLSKPTSADDHGGGERFRRGEWEYRLLRAWIAGGANPLSDTAPAFTRLEVSPPEIVFSGKGQEQQLRVVAVWEDGSREDVTPLTRFQSNNDAVALVTDSGLVRAAGAGDTHVVCFYDNGVQPVPIIQPVSGHIKEKYPKQETATRIDAAINAKLAKLGIVPSELCSDDAFLRRLSLDLIGTLPTPDEIREFVADTTADKRIRKIEELLERPAYVAWWTVRLCDLTGHNSGYLGGTEMASVVAEQWRAWMERRVRDNIGWDRIAEGIILGTSRKPGQSYEDFAAEQSEYTRSVNPKDYTAIDNTMPHYWYRENQALPKDKALAFGYVFLGIRLQCAECHKHPFDQWSQEDFQQFTEFFTRIKRGVAPDAAEVHNSIREMLGVPDKLNTAATRRQSYLRVAAEGRIIPWNEIYIEGAGADPQPARLLGGNKLDLNQYADPRVPLMEWLRQKDNDYFAKAFVNRIWANYFNVGIIDPPDDLNLANPPSNGELLEYLASEFVAQGYNMKWLHREIAASHAYQRSWRTNPTNRADERNFSRAVVRRLPAEVVVDAVTQSTANSDAMKQASSQVAGRAIAHHPRSYQARTLDYAMLVFGKPLRTTNCDCERQSSPTLLQSLYLRNDQEVFQKIGRSDGWANELLRVNSPMDASKTTNAEMDRIIEEAYLRTLSRWPTAEERLDCRRHFNDAENTYEALRDLLWALLNTHEFVTNH